MKFLLHISSFKSRLFPYSSITLTLYEIDSVSLSCRNVIITSNGVIIKSLIPIPLLLVEFISIFLDESSSVFTLTLNHQFPTLINSALSSPTSGMHLNKLINTSNSKLSGI